MSLALMSTTLFTRLTAVVTADPMGGQSRAWTAASTFNGFIYYGSATIKPTLGGRYSEQMPAFINCKTNPSVQLGDVVRFSDTLGGYVYLTVKAQRPVRSPYFSQAVCYILECVRSEPPVGTLP